MIEVTSFDGQNWLIMPAGRGVSQAAPAPADQEFLMVLSGVALVNFPGLPVDDWHRDTASIVPDFGPALDSAIDLYGVPRPAGTEGSQYTTGFQLVNWVPFAGLGSVFAPHGTPDIGFAVDTWRPLPFATATNLAGAPVNQLFAGIAVDVAARDTAAILYRVGFQVTLLGRIRFLQEPTIEVKH
jgi:hypothetical protein